MANSQLINQPEFQAAHRALAHDLRRLEDAVVLFGYRGVSVISHGRVS